MNISMEQRYPLIMDILKKSDKPLSTRQIVNRYILNSSASDPLVTGTILNVLVLSGVVNRVEEFKGRTVRLFYELAK